MAYGNFAQNFKIHKRLCSDVISSDADIHYKEVLDSTANDYIQGKDSSLTKTMHRSITLNDVETISNEDQSESNATFDQFNYRTSSLQAKLTLSKDEQRSKSGISIKYFENS